MLHASVPNNLGAFEHWIDRRPLLSCARGGGSSDLGNWVGIWIFIVLCVGNLMKLGRVLYNHCHIIRLVEYNQSFNNTGQSSRSSFARKAGLQ